MSEERFEFGKNWKAFLQTVDQDRIDQSIKSLCDMLNVSTLSGQSFLDIGCGSGLFSLAAHKLGATVRSFDYDNDSVECTKYLRKTYAGDPSDARNPTVTDNGLSESGATEWQVHDGSVLDTPFMESLGTYNIVYSWGVLHHTGNLSLAMENAIRCVADEGTLFIAIYNDQGAASRRWLAIKRTYNKLPAALRPLLVALVATYYEGKFALARLKNGENPLPFADWRAKKKDRGMSVWYDWVDWVGGLPFEYATPELIQNTVEARGFKLVKLTTVGRGWGCNEFVFKRSASEAG